MSNTVTYYTAVAIDAKGKEFPGFVGVGDTPEEASYLALAVHPDAVRTFVRGKARTVESKSRKARVARTRKPKQAEIDNPESPFYWGPEGEK